MLHHFSFRRQIRPRRLVLLMVVRDERDVLADNLRFHFQLGVDFALVLDNGSTDGSQEVLEEFRKEGRLDWRPEPDPAYRQSMWMTGLARRAREEFGADWLLCCDADEFWQPAEGDLKTFIERQRAPVLRCVRRNEARVLSEIAGSAPAFLEQQFVPVERPRAWQTPCAERSRRELSDPAIPGVIFHEEAPKVLARADVTSGITQGNHDIVEVRGVRRVAPTGLILRHFPIRTASQFFAKVRQGAPALIRSGLPPAMAWHWHHWHACDEAGQLVAAFRREIVPEPPPREWGGGVRLGRPRSAGAALSG
jgi:hypothetical protein